MKCAWLKKKKKRLCWGQKQCQFPLVSLFVKTGDCFFFFKGKNVAKSNCMLFWRNWAISLYDRQDTGNIFLPIFHWYCLFAAPQILLVPTYICKHAPTPRVSYFLLQALRVFASCHVNQHYDHTNIPPPTPHKHWQRPFNISFLMYFPQHLLMQYCQPVC